MSEAAHHLKIKRAGILLAAGLTALSAASAQRLDGGLRSDRLQPASEPAVQELPLPRWDELEQPAFDDPRTVHLASYYTEADARLGWDVLTSRHAELLEGREPMLRQVDLGDRGVFVRLLAGPLPGPAEAARLCEGLASAGAYCVPADAAGEFLLPADGF